MRKINTIFSFLVIGIFIFPLKYVDFCVTHPFGHHHEKGKPSTCELKKQYKGKDAVFWPAMHCHKIITVIDDFQITDYQFTDIPDGFETQFNLFQSTKLMYFEKNIFYLPDPKCNSGPLIYNQTLRGPPNS